VDQLSCRRKSWAVFLFLTAAAIPSHAQSFTTLANFTSTNGPPSEYSSLVPGADGNLYGTTGVIVANHLGNTVFKTTLSGTLTTLYSFGAITNPYGGLIQAADGNFYGTTSGGGAALVGTVFRISSEGILTTLHSFVTTDGAVPYAGVVQGTDGSFYGTTTQGGASMKGTVFKIAPGGTLTTLYSFGSTAADGASPFGGLVQATDGNFYGTTQVGGASGFGTVFKITPAGTLTILHSFSLTDGSAPYSRLIQAADGNLYGTASQGGTYISGTVFKITLSGTLTTVYNFGSTFGSTDGSGPYSALVQATDGNFYGTTLVGGTNGAGTVFKLTPTGMLTTLHSFVTTDGSEPAGLVQAADGNLYGTTRGGGTNNNGTFFKLALASTTSIAPTILPSGVVPVYSSSSIIQPGEWVSIYGTNLASAAATWTGNFPTSLGGTSVTINGKSAYLWVVSPTQINLQSPDDTATGTVPVAVTTASGTATSTVTLAPFAPSFLLLDAKHVTGIILRSNGSGAYGGGSYDIIGPTGTSLGYPTVAAKAGDIVELFGVGFGPTSPPVLAGQVYSGSAATTNHVGLLINNAGVTPSFAGISGAGLYQINLTVPSGLGTGDVPLVGTVGGVQTQTGVVISLQ
jgi:uncharacterized protein (TIGR03437 family)